MEIFGKIAERKIQEAMESGAFDNLPGRGRPLNLEDETWIPEDLRAAYRVLKNSGHIPPELELRNEIINMKEIINTIDDDRQRLKKIRELDFKIMRLEMMRKTPLNLRNYPEYESKFFDKMISS